MRRITLFILFAFALPFIENVTGARMLPLCNSRSSLSEKRDNSIVLKSRFDDLVKTGTLSSSTEFLNLFFAIKDNLKGEELIRAKELFRNYYESPLHLDELNRLAEGWSQQIEDKERLSRKINDEYERRYKRFCERSAELHLTQEALQYVVKEFGKDSGIAKLFTYVIDKVKNADYKLGNENFVVYEDVPVFIRHHGPAGDGLPFPTEEAVLSTPWLAALFYMTTDIDMYNTGAIGGKYVKTYVNLCYDILQSDEKMKKAEVFWNSYYNGSLKDYLAKTCLVTMCTNNKVSSKEKAAFCLNARISVLKDSYPDNRQKEFKEIEDIAFDKSVKKVVQPTIYVDICYNLYEWYSKEISTEDKVTIIDECLIAFDDIQKGNMQWDYSKKSPMDMLKKKKTVIVNEYGKDSDEYKNFITDDVIARFGEYSEEYDAIVNN